MTDRPTVFDADQIPASHPVVGEPIAPLDAAALEAAVTAAVRAEMDQVIPHVVAALKSNEGVAQLAQRLDVAEKRLTERDRRPTISRIYRLLTLVRKLDLPLELKQILVGEIEAILVGAGYEEFGEIGEPADGHRHEALDGGADGGTPVVTHVYEPGLETLGEVLVRARVRIGPRAEAIPRSNPEFS